MINNNKKTIFFDLDGTLLDNLGVLSDDVKSTLIDNKSEYNYVLASGRPFRLIEEYIGIFKKNFFEYVICRDGLYICDDTGRIVMESERLNIDDLMFISTKVDTFYIFTKDYDYLFVKSFFGAIKKKIVYAKKRNVRVIRKVEKVKSPIEKVQFTKKICKNISTFNRGFECLLVMNRFYELNRRGINKAHGIAFLKDKFGIREEDLIYFGDDLNDISCFQSYRYCIAMGNACEEVKKLAFYVTDTVTNNGIGKAIDYLKEEGIL